MAAAVDPTTGVVGSAYISLDDELIVWAPILAMGAAVGLNAQMVGPFADALLIDKVTVWEKLAEILLASNALTVIKAEKTSQNRRLASFVVYALPRPKQCRVHGQQALRFALLMRMLR